MTGAASGIGAAVCRAMAVTWRGSCWCTRARTAQAPTSVASEVRAAGADAEVALGDLADPAVAPAVIAHAVERFGGLDVLISNAGFADRTPFADTERCGDDGIRRGDPGRVLSPGPRRNAAPEERRNARIVAVSSFVAHAFRPDVPLFAASAAAKAGLEALVRALAMELASSGVTVNAVVPGFIRKDPGAHVAIDPERLRRQVAGVPLGRVGLPEEVAAAVGF